MAIIPTSSNQPPFIPPNKTSSNFPSVEKIAVVAGCTLAAALIHYLRPTISRFCRSFLPLSSPTPDREAALKQQPQISQTPPTPRYPMEPHPFLQEILDCYINLPIEQFKELESLLRIVLNVPCPSPRIWTDTRKDPIEIEQSDLLLATSVQEIKNALRNVAIISAQRMPPSYRLSSSAHKAEMERAKQRLIEPLESIQRLLENQKLHPEDAFMLRGCSHEQWKRGELQPCQSFTNRIESITKKLNIILHLS